MTQLEKKIRLINKDMYGFHSTIRCTLLSSRFMGLLPLGGLSCPLSHDLRFTLRSPYTLFYVVSLVGQFGMFIMNLYWLTQNGISLPNITNTVFYSSSLISSVILLNIGRFWPNLIKQVEAIETKLPPISRNVSKLCNSTMVFILMAALVEHLLSVYYGITVAKSCDPDSVADTYFLYNMPWIFDYTPPALWKEILSEIFNAQSTFIWSFNDLILMVISIYLTEHFIIHNELLEKAVKYENVSFNEFRIQYLNIVRLVKLINEQIGIYILTSIASDLYWICTQLFYCVNKSKTGHFIACPNSHESHHGIEHAIYFVYSFSFLVLRTLLVLLLAARINSTSVLPLVILDKVSSCRFNTEVQRYIDQINNIKVALSGLDFFYVTRTMILTLMGTIVTYELVLLHYNKS